MQGGAKKRRHLFSKFKKTLTLYSWALYDFANTIFSAVVLTFYFPLYLTDLTHKNLNLGLATSGATVLAGLVVPWLGALSDRTGRTKTYLLITTLLCVGFTFGLSFFVYPSLLIITFLLACFSFHASLVFYNALLPVVAESEKQGFASGLGTGLGYLGVLFAIPLAHLVDSFFGRRFVFLVAGSLFLIFSLPLFAWVPERKVLNPLGASFDIFIKEWKKVLTTLGRITRNRPLLFFFTGNFFVMEAVNTAIFWFVIYLARVFGPPQKDLILIFLGLNFCAFLFGFAAGFLTDRYGSQKIFLLSALSLLVTFLSLGLSRDLKTFIAASFTAGAFALAGVWTAGRKRLIELAPPDAVGEYFGLYNLTTKISVIGSLVFSILADRYGFRIALLSGMIPSGLGAIFLWLGREKRLLTSSGS